MIPIQPTSVWKYLCKKKTSIKSGIGHKFYLSWEDALWDVLRSFDIPKDSIILVPSFFCMDVVDNMKAHGLNSVFFNLNKNLQADEKEVINLIKKYNPKLIIIFHAVGIRNTLLDSKVFIKSIPESLILIEDAVHQLVNPQKVEIVKKNHFILASLRKVVPLQGGILFGKKEDILKLKGSTSIDFSYIIKVLIYWSLMQSSLLIQKYIPFVHVKKTSGEYAEKFMLKGYEIIGDSIYPAWCPSIFSKIFFYINFEKIKNIKKEQVKIYKKELRNSDIFFSEKDERELHGFPIVLNKKYADEFISRIRNEGIYLRKELEGCLWTKKYSIIYLPLGPYLENDDITYIINKINTINAY